MENATKALLISASVLIALILIGLGIKLVSSATKTANYASEASNAIDSGLSSAVGKFSQKVSGGSNAGTPTTSEDQAGSIQQGDKPSVIIDQSDKLPSSEVEDFGNAGAISDPGVVENPTKPIGPDAELLPKPGNLDSAY